MVGRGRSGGAGGEVVGSGGRYVEGGMTQGVVQPQKIPKTNFSFRTTGGQEGG